MTLPDVIKTGMRLPIPEELRDKCGGATECEVEDEIRKVKAGELYFCGEVHLWNLAEGKSTYRYQILRPILREIRVGDFVKHKHGGVGLVLRCITHDKFLIHVHSGVCEWHRHEFDGPHKPNEEWLALFRALPLIKAIKEWA